MNKLTYVKHRIGMNRCLFSLIVFFLLSSNLRSQTFKLYDGDTINRTNNMGEKIGLWYFFHSNGELMSKMSYKDGKPFGFMIVHDSLGNISESGFWNDGRWQGNYESYYPNGIKKWQITFDKKGRQIGYSLSYYKNGIVKSFQFYLDSLNTVSAKYDSTGNRTELKATFDLIKDSDENVISTINDFVTKENTVSRQKDQLKRNRIIFLLGSILLLVFIFFLIALYRNNNFKKKMNIVLGEQKDLLEEKNKEITDSINYAQRIQKAILPPLEEVKVAFPDSFVLYKPKDIVSGDFYWFRKNENDILLAAADCTGHGVPGAIMSVICSEKLTEAAISSSNVSELLNKANVGIKNTLRQTESNESTRDGMDICLCHFDNELKVVTYAGANRPLWLIRKDSKELTEIKATKAAIGGLTSNDQSFVTNILKLDKGDTIYLFTDGYADQFSNQDKKLMTRKFKEILLSIQTKSMSEQYQLLNEYIENWKGEMEQTDDILVIGVRA